MRTRHRLIALFATGLVVSTASGAFGFPDFDPHGRHHNPGPQPGPGPRPGPGPAPVPGPAPAPAGPTAAVLIERYTRALLQPPYGAALPMQKLPQLYRDRDGNIQKLIADFEQRVQSAPDDGQKYGAMVALAGFYKDDGRIPDSLKTYESAIALRPSDPTALLLLAHQLQDRGDLAPARDRYVQALPLQTAQPDKEQTIRTLMELSLDLRDWDGAKKWHEELVKLEPNSMFVKGELGHQLFSRNEFDRAEAELRAVVTAAAGDNRALAPALKELGRCLAMEKKNKDALDTLNRALDVAGPNAAVRADIYSIITEVYRAEEQLPVLVKKLEDEHPGDYDRLALLGALYEETGDSNKAIETYRKALAVNPHAVDLRVKMIRLLQANGELEKAIAEYEGLIRSEPNNPDYVFEECDALLQRGDRSRALKLLTDLEARSAGDEEVLNQLAEHYSKIGENDRALAVLKRLADISTSDPGHLVDLGDRYYQDGNTQLADQTWRRILVMIQPKAKAEAALGDVYLEHDEVDQALKYFQMAVADDPSSDEFKKSLAAAYERAHKFGEARALYLALVDKGKATNDAQLLRECRTKLVNLWGLENVLDQQILPLQRQFTQNPPDVEAGRLLAEVYGHLHQTANAEGVLTRVIQLAPGDVESYLALERVLVSENKLEAAIHLLEKLAEVDPKQQRQVFQRMATYAMQIYSDEEAIKYAARAVALNPDDAEGHRRLAEMYRGKQDTDHAIAEFRAAIAKNERNWLVYFELADLLLSKGQTDEADRLFRRVVRSAPDEELVARAARLSMQINLGKGTLDQLENDLLPLAIAMPQKPIYRRLLVEIYGNMTFGLVQRVHHGRGHDADDARRELAKIGNRAVKPLLDALADQDVGQQRIAIDVLGYVENKNAALPLFSYATGPSDLQLRMRAMIACGALRDGSLVPKYDALLFPKDDAAVDSASSDGVAVAAAWGLAKLGDPHASPLLLRIARTGTPQMRALAVLGLGLARDKAAIPDIAAIARAVDSGNVARAAAAYALGELSADGETPTLLTLAEGSDPLPRQMALLALARMGAGRAEPPGGRATLDAMADAVFAGGDPESPRARKSAEELQDAGVDSLTILAAPSSLTLSETLPVPEDGNVDVEAMIDSLVPSGAKEEDRAAAFVKYADPIRRAALGALQTSSDRARVVLDALGSGEGELDPFFGKPASPPPQAALSGGAGAQPPANDPLAAARAKARELATALEPSIVPLVRHPDPSIRTKAVVLLSRSKTPVAASAVVQAVDDPSEAVQRVALAAIGGQPTPEAVKAVARLLATDENWAMRVLAAQAMGRLGGAAKGAAPGGDAAKDLETAATSDTYALVREAALQALATFDAANAKALAARMSTADPEPRVRETAQAIARR